MNYFDRAWQWKCSTCIWNCAKAISVVRHTSWSSLHSRVFRRTMRPKCWDESTERIREPGLHFQCGSCHSSVSYLHLGTMGASPGPRGASSGKPFDPQLRGSFKREERHWHVGAIWHQNDYMRHELSGPSRVILALALSGAPLSKSLGTVTTCALSTLSCRQPVA